ncbi:hypothetical protein GEOBRER4_n2406 [Citrifermentans bremense]|uniref:Uncharacterized protein n=1 Tax=Citrifermentans bremense TaxID=60035 RepID=A0A7R7FSG8_9BACT|nr:hypothetical protein GEOBRER4_n2406 [Citrifermentans bremense]
MKRNLATNKRFAGIGDPRHPCLMLVSAFAFPRLNLSALSEPPRTLCSA